MEENVETNNASEHNMAENPNWLESDQLRDWGVELGSTEKNSGLVV